MNSTASERQFSPETGEVPEYRSTSRLAILAAIIAVLSPAALFHPLLAIFAWVAAILAGLALLTMTEQHSGRLLAMCVLVPTLIFGTLGPTHYFSKQHRMFTDAREFALQWLEMIDQGRLMEAHQLTLTFYERQPANISLESHYRNPFTESQGIPSEEEMHGPFSNLMEFQNKFPISVALEWPGGFDAEFLGNRESLRGTAESKTIGLRFRLNGKAESAGESIRITIFMQRFERDKVGFWRVLDFESPDQNRPRIVDGKIVYPGSRP